MKFTSVLALAFFGFAYAAYADLKVEKINSDNTRVHLVGDVAEPTMNSTLNFTDEFDVTCSAKVVKFEPNKVIADVSGCANAKEIKKGSVFTVGTAKTSSASTPTATNPTGLPTENESWYLLAGMGLAGISYHDEEVDDAMEDADDAPGVDRSMGALDVGAYWPLAGHKMMHGVSWGIVSDSLSNDDDEELRITQHTLAYSFHQFFGENIGHKWFWRGDVGLAKAVLNIDVVGFPDLDEDTDVGFGLVGGGGYAWRIGGRTRILAGAYLHYMKADDFKSSALSIKATGLW